MTFLTMLAALQAAAAPPPVAAWNTLPLFPLPRATTVVDEATTYVRSEVAAGRCRAAVETAAGHHLSAPLSILVGPAGIVRQIVPMAIDCPTVEQFTVGYILSMTRNGPGSATGLQQGWYRLTVDYRWP
jgi:hypothetical protein